MDYEADLPGSGRDVAGEAPAGAPPGVPGGAGQGWTRWLRLAVSVAILAAIAFGLRRLDLRGAAPLVPAAPLFWLAFLAYYFTPVFGDWIIYRRLWRLPVSGIAALLRKLVSNELLFGYSGEAYFFAWASRHGIAGNRFGIIKDVSILSALAGNAVTLALVVAVWPLLRASPLGHDALDGAVLGLAGLSFVIGLVQWRFLVLARRDLLFVLCVQFVRIGTTTALGFLLWHLALPEAKIGWLLVLAAFRLLVSRVPFVPNKDLAFAGLALLMIGRQGDVAAMIAMIATLLFATHLLFGAVLAVAEMVALKRRR